MNSSLSTVLDSSIDFYKNLFEQGVSHSAVIQLIHKAGLDFGVEIHVEEFLKDPTMRHLSALISNPAPMSRPQPGQQAPLATPKTAALDDFLELAKEANLGFAIEVDRDLFEQGATSLAILNLVQKAKRRFGIEINVEEFLKNPTLRYLGDLARAKTRPIRTTAHVAATSRRPCAGCCGKPTDSSCKRPASATQHLRSVCRRNGPISRDWVWMCANAPAAIANPPASAGKPGPRRWWSAISPIIAARRGRWTCCWPSSSSGAAG